MNNNYASIILPLALCSTFLNAQKCFEKGVNIIEPGIGIGVYKVEFHDITNNTPVSSDSTAAKLFLVGFEHGLNNWFGVGGKFNYSSYFTNDSTSERAHGLDFAVFVRGHALRTKHVDLFAGLDFGYSHFAYDANNYTGGIARADGTYFGFNLNSRFFIGKVLGLRLFYNFDYYNYPNGTISDSASNSYKFSWKSKSFFLLGAGLVFKL